MMIKVKSKIKRNSIILSFVCILVNFFGLITGTLAWFACNNQVSASGMQVTCSDERINIDYNVYKRDATTFLGTDKDDNGDDLRVEDITFLTYDTIFVQRNVNTPVVLRAELSGEALEESGTISFAINRDTSKSNGELDELDMYFTSIIDFSCTIDNSIYNSDANTLYENALGIFQDPSNAPEKQSFTTGDEENGWSKVDSIIFNLSYTASDWNNDKLNIYLYMNYNAELITSYIHQAGIKTDAITDNYSTFVSDLRNIYINYGK